MTDRKETDIMIRIDKDGYRIFYDGMEDYYPNREYFIDDLTRYILKRAGDVQ